MVVTIVGLAAPESSDTVGLEVPSKVEGWLPSGSGPPPGCSVSDSKQVYPDLWGQLKEFRNGLPQKYNVSSFWADFTRELVKERLTLTHTDASSTARHMFAEVTAAAIFAYGGMDE